MSNIFLCLCAMYNVSTFYTILIKDIGQNIGVISIIKLCLLCVSKTQIKTLMKHPYCVLYFQQCFVTQNRRRVTHITDFRSLSVYLVEVQVVRYLLQCIPISCHFERHKNRCAMSPYYVSRQKRSFGPPIVVIDI